MTSTTDFWHYVQSNNISWATRCRCSNTCPALQLAPPSSVLASRHERDHLKRVLRMAAQCMLNIVFVGEGCGAMAQSPEMADTLSALGASTRLQTVRFVAIDDTDQIAPLLRALERCPKLMWLTCPIEAYLAPAVRRLESGSASLRLVTVVVDDAAQFRHLRAAAAASVRNKKQRIELTFTNNCDDATALQLAAELTNLVALSQPNWTQILLANTAIKRSTYDQLKSICARSGNASSMLNKHTASSFSGNPHACMRGALRFDWVSDAVGIDPSHYKMMRFDFISPGDAATQNLITTIGIALAKGTAGTTTAAPAASSATPSSPSDGVERAAPHGEQNLTQIVPNNAFDEGNVAIAAPPDTVCATVDGDVANGAPGPQQHIAPDNAAANQDQNKSNVVV
jgi:hypothetical protein